MGRISAIILALGFAAAGLFVKQGIIESRRDRTVEVRGLAEREVDADLGIWEIRFKAAASELTELNSAVTQAHTAIAQFITESGFKQEEIRRGAVTTSDATTDYGGRNNQNAPRFIANGSVFVTSREVQKLAQVAAATDQLLARGVVVESSYVRFNFTGLNDVKPGMVKEATANAREAAEGFARDSGAALGKLRNATQGLFSISTPGQDYEDSSSIRKKVRVVTRVVFDLN